MRCGRLGVGSAARRSGATGGRSATRPNHLRDQDLHDRTTLRRPGRTPSGYARPRAGRRAVPALRTTRADGSGRCANVSPKTPPQSWPRCERRPARAKPGSNRAATWSRRGSRAQIDPRPGRSERADAVAANSASRSATSPLFRDPMKRSPRGGKCRGRDSRNRIPWPGSLRHNEKPYRNGHVASHAARHESRVIRRPPLDTLRARLVTLR